MSFLDRIHQCQGADLSAYLPFIVDGGVVGYVKPGFVGALKDYPDIFGVTDQCLGLNAGLVGPARRTISALRNQSLSMAKLQKRSTRPLMTAY